MCRTKVRHGVYQKSRAWRRKVLEETMIARNISFHVRRTHLLSVAVCAMSYSDGSYVLGQARRRMFTPASVCAQYVAKEERVEAQSRRIREHRIDTEAEFLSSPDTIQLNNIAGA